MLVNRSKHELRKRTDRVSKEELTALESSEDKRLREAVSTQTEIRSRFSTLSCNAIGRSSTGVEGDFMSRARSSMKRSW
jgi:hypothetical protein